MEISNIYKALLKKELLSFKKQKFIIFFSFAIPLMLAAFTLYESIYSLGTEATNEIKSFFITYQMQFISIYSIPTTIIMTFSKSVIAERKEKTNDVLMAIGIPQKTIWTIKILFSYIVALVVLFIDYLIYLIGCKLLIGVFPSLTLMSGVLIFFVMPVLCLSVSMVLCLLYWVLKNNALVSLCPTFLMYIAVFGSMKLQNYHFGVNLVVIPLFVISALYIISINVINKISNEYISNLN